MTAGQGVGEPGARARAVLWGLVAVTLVAFLVERARIGLSMPVPWPDEGSFLFPALALRDYFTLLAPEINPNRPVLWQPPGFMLFLGALFKVVPFSLDAARTVSALLLTGSFACVAATFRKYRSAPILPLLFPVFLFSPIFLVVGNVARMEAYVLFLSAAAFALLAAGRALGLAVLAITPLFHPNGLFPALFGIPYFLIAERGKIRLTRREWIAFGAVGVAWAAYAVYVLGHLDAFRQDMWNQLRFKTLVSLEDGGPLVRVRLPVIFGPAVVLAACAALARRLSARTAPLLVLGACFVVQTVAASGWLYEVYIGFAALLAAVVAVETFAAFTARTTLPPAVRWVAVLAVTASAGALGFVAVRTEFAERSLARAIVKRPGVSPPYYTGEDRFTVAAYLDRLAEKRGAISVQFVPDGDALVFEALRGPRMRFVVQTFYIGSFDVAVVHDSIWCPSYVHDLEFLHALGLHHWVKPRTTVIRARDGTERWTVYEWDELSPENEIQL